jgi:hypothetical protein
VNRESDVVKKEIVKKKNESDPPVFRMSIPRFISDEDLGLGDVVKRVTSSMGIKTCGGCQRRAERLNHWLVFSGGRANSRNL